MEYIRPYVMSRDQIRAELKRDREIAAKKHGVSPYRLRYEGAQIGRGVGMYIHLWTIMQPGHPSDGSTVSGPVYKLPKESTKKEVVVDPDSLKAKGWYLEDYHKIWLKEGSADLLEVPIESVVESGEYKEGLPNPKNVEEMKLDLQSGHRLPVVEGFRLGGKYKISDGMHRFTAAKKLGRSTIPMMVTREKSTKKEGESMEKIENFVLDLNKFKSRLSDLKKSKLIGKKIPVRTARGIEFYKSVRNGVVVKGQGHRAKVGDKALIKGILTRVTAVGRDGVTARDAQNDKYQAFFKDVELIRRREELRK